MVRSRQPCRPRSAGAHRFSRGTPCTLFQPADCALTIDFARYCTPGDDMAPIMRALNPKLHVFHTRFNDLAPKLNAPCGACLTNMPVTACVKNRVVIVSLRTWNVCFREQIVRCRALNVLKRARSLYIVSFRAQAARQRGPTMRRYHPKPFNEVPVSFELDLKLKEASMLNPLKLETWEIAERAINEWLAKNEPETIPMPSFAGIQWKKLFLPNGTVLRTVFGGKNHHCRVEDDQLRYEGKATSPSGFANLVGGIRRNAWKVIWILFPQSQTWQLANDLRPARSRRQASRPAPLASGDQPPRPARPEPASAGCCRCGQCVPADAGYDEDQRPAAVGQPTVCLDRQPKQAAAPLAQDLQQLAVEARKEECKRERAEQQARHVSPPGERTCLNQCDEARAGLIDRRQRGPCRRRQLSGAALLL